MPLFSLERFKTFPLIVVCFPEFGDFMIQISATILRHLFQIIS